MRKSILLAPLFVLITCFAPLCAEDVSPVKPHTVIALGRYNKPKHTRYEIGSIGGTRFVHDKLYERGVQSSRYNIRSREQITGLWSKVKIDQVLFDAQLAYTYDTYKYDRAYGAGGCAHSRFHGYSLEGIVDARYRAIDLKVFKFSPIIGFSYKHSHKRAHTEKYSNNGRSYEKEDADVLRLRLGTSLEGRYKICSRECWVYSELMYVRVLHDSDPASKYTVNGGNTQVVHSNFQKKDGFELTIGTAINVFKRWDVILGYQLFTDNKLSSHAIQWRVSYNF